MGVGHYENFPVASLLLPQRLRASVRAIYRFARTADDIADEGDATAAARLEQLADLAGQLDAIERNAANAWPDLHDAIVRHDLPLAPLRDLLSAFRQDVLVHRYPDYDALLDYCRRSANPVGRLLLALFGRSDPRLVQWSDAICTGLQLVNFWQDVALDWSKGRVYLPQSELHRFAVAEAAIASGQAGGRWAELMRAQTTRAAALLQAGRPLAGALGGRIGIELRLVIEGGLRIARRVDAVDGDVFRHRPRLGPADWVTLPLRALARMFEGAPAARTGRIES
jgi:squalene synthase HpnC